MSDDAFALLKKAGVQHDDNIDLAELGISFFACDHEGISKGRYFSHFKVLKDDVIARHRGILDAGGTDDAASILAALKFVLCDTYDYQADDADYEVLDSADLLRVIDRARGHVVCLSFLSMVVLRSVAPLVSAPCLVEGLNIPGRFVCRLTYKGEALIFDPASQFQLLQAHDLRQSVKDAKGEGAELVTAYLDGLDGRATLVRLSNLIKTRHIEMGDYAHALHYIERMRMFAPDEYRLLLDSGVLHARLSNNNKARAFLNDYISKAPHEAERYEARLVLDGLSDDV